jgi:hypothetical protein
VCAEIRSTASESSIEPLAELISTSPPVPVTRTSPEALLACTRVPTGTISSMRVSPECPRSERVSMVMRCDESSASM